MAINKYVIKKNHLESVIRFENAGTVSSYLIKASSILLKRNENLLSDPIIYIGNIEWSTMDSEGYAEISRDNVVTHKMFGSGEFEMAYGADTDHSDADILIRLNKGTVVIRFLKVSGYVPKFTPEQNGGIQEYILTADSEYLVASDNKLILGA